MQLSGIITEWGANDMCNSQKESNHFVYKYVYKGEIIYIGKTDGPLENRIKQHGKSGDNIPSEYHSELNNSEIYYFRTANNIMSDVIESELIRRHNPKLNKAKKSSWFGLDFPEVKWERFTFRTKNHKVSRNRIKTPCHSSPFQNFKVAEQELEDFKKRIQALIDFAKAEEGKTEFPVKNESEMNLYMSGVGVDAPIMFYFLRPPITGLHTKTNQYYVVYSVSRLKKWLIDDLADYELQLNNAINDCVISIGGD